MTQLFAICDATTRVKTERLAYRLVDHLEAHFGSAKVLGRNEMRQIKDKRSQATWMVTSSIVAPSYCNLFGESVDFIKDGKINGDNLKYLNHGKAAFDWTCTLRNNEVGSGRAHEFIVIDTDLEDSFLCEARLAPITDTVLVLDNYVKPKSHLVNFARSALERLPNCRLGVVVYSETHASQALDMYCQFESLIEAPDMERLSFLGHLPKYKKGHNHNTVETIGLQSIALSLLKLNYQTFPRNIMHEMFKGTLH